MLSVYTPKTTYFKKHKNGHGLFGPRQAEKCLQTCAKCTDLNHPAHTQSIIKAFDLQSYIL